MTNEERIVPTHVGVNRRFDAIPTPSTIVPTHVGVNR